MIYMVLCHFGDAAREAAWNEWYSDHLGILLTVPGIETAQRFQQVGAANPWYRAVYTLASPEVFESEAYRNRKGGRFPPEWREAVLDHSRDIFAGIDEAPEVQPDEYLLVREPGPTGNEDVTPLGIDWVTIEAAGLDRSVPQLELAVIKRAEAPSPDALPAGVTMLEPLTVRKRSTR